MARAGVASRRACEALIADGKVSVNGKIVTELGFLVNAASDVIEVNGRRISREAHVYYLLHKPVGYISTAKDEHGRRTVLDLVPNVPRVYPVGRLDYDTSGLLLLTNDGQLAFTLTHPKFEAPRVYVATIEGDVSEDVVKRLLTGISLEDGEARADRVTVLRTNNAGRIEIELHEGRNRLVRRMLDAVGRPVLHLERRSFGPLTLGRLAPGQFRILSKDELAGLVRFLRTSQQR